MRILIIGFVAFVVWSLFSVWLYFGTIEPMMSAPQVVQEIPEQISVPQTAVADSVSQPEILKPDEIIVYFSFNDFTFNSESEIDKKFNEVKAWLNKESESKLSIIGHADNVGSNAYNQKLGLKRAQAIQAYLEGLGIQSEKIIKGSMGEEQPMVDNSTEEGRAKNRRAVLILNN